MQQILFSLFDRIFLVTQQSAANQLKKLWTEKTQLFPANFFC
jgi:hypothetical protein